MSWSTTMFMLKSIRLGVVKFGPVNQNVDWQMDGRTDQSKDRPTHQSHQWSGWMHPIKLSITRCLSGDPLCHRCFLVDMFPRPSQTFREIQFDWYMIFFMSLSCRSIKVFLKGCSKDFSTSSPSQRYDVMAYTRYIFWKYGGKSFVHHIYVLWWTSPLDNSSRTACL